MNNVRMLIRMEWSLCSYYRELIKIVSELGTNWPWKLILKAFAPAKVAYFGWMVAHEACLTQDKLIRRYFSICSRCYLCENSFESIDHLFCTVIIPGRFGPCLCFCFSMQSA